MTRVTMRLCYLCFQDGSYVKATAFYLTGAGESFDVCDKHKNICESEGFDTFPLDDSEVIEERT